MQKQTEAKLQEVFRAVFSLPANADVTGVQQQTTAAWDSLAHAMLIAAVESEFDLSIDPGDSLDMTSYHATAQYLEAHGL